MGTMEYNKETDTLTITTTLDEINKTEILLRTESLAHDLHEAGRAAVEAGNTVAAEKFGEQTRKFLEWDEITEPAKEGRRIQARYLLNKYTIKLKTAA